MATVRPKGYGQELFGDPFGSGGFLHVVRARAMASHVVRVVFDETPVFKSPAGRTDARNPANYSFSAVVPGTVLDPGTGRPTSPSAVGVDSNLIVGPVASVLAGDERAVDVHVDRALVSGVVYRVEVRNVLSALGGVLGAPFTADFAGIFSTLAVRPPRNPVGFKDIDNDITNGLWVIDDSGDLAPHDGIESLRKRIFRRLTTSRGGFSFLPDYGIGLVLKEPASSSALSALKTDITKQVEREPEVEAASVLLSLDPRGVLTVQIAARTKQGAIVDVQARRLENGIVIP